MSNQTVVVNGTKWVIPSCAVCVSDSCSITEEPCKSCVDDRNFELAEDLDSEDRLTNSFTVNR